MKTSTKIQIDSSELSSKRVLVTGGTKGMGEAIVKRLRQAGATVITTARSIPEGLNHQNSSSSLTSVHPRALIKLSRKWSHVSVVWTF